MCVQSEMDPLSEERNMYNQLSLEGFLNMGTVKIDVLKYKGFHISWQEEIHGGWLDPSCIGL